MAYLTEVIHDAKSASALQTRILGFRLASADGNDLVLEAPREMLGILAKAVHHVQASFLKFEMSIRIKLEFAELVHVGRILEEFSPLNRCAESRISAAEEGPPELSTDTAHLEAKFKYAANFGVSDPSWVSFWL
jgi:hypothetical protein